MRLLLEFHRKQHADNPFAVLRGEQEYTRRTEAGEAEIGTIDWDETLHADLTAVHGAAYDIAVVQRLGDRLQRFLKQSDATSLLEKLAEAVRRSEPAYVTFRFSAAELFALPWEFLTIQATGLCIGELSNVLIRYEWPGSRSEPDQQSYSVPRYEGGRILFAWSTAGGNVPAAAHQEALMRACPDGFFSFDASRDVLPNVSINGLSKMLSSADPKAPFSVLHILCHGQATTPTPIGSSERSKTGTWPDDVHGSTFGLAWDGVDGPEVIDGARLRALLKPFASNLRLVVLCACNSGNNSQLGNHLGSVALALHRAGIQAVVASRNPLSASGSIDLADTLFGTLLGEPASLESAVLASRQKLLSSGGLDWASVQLYARDADGDDTRPVVIRPFRGLAAFQTEHRPFFFGRTAEVDEVLTKLQALIAQGRPRCVLVVGASGAGKSSLVFAGVVPKFLASNKRTKILRIHPGTAPNETLENALADCPAGRPALLVVDQFEELFAQTENQEAREKFARKIWSLASTPAASVQVIITLRLDVIGRCRELVLNNDDLSLDEIALAKQYENHRVAVLQLKREQLSAAILEPARKVGLTLQPGLAARMLDDVGREPGAMPLLSDALNELWERRLGRMLTQASYDELGGVTGSLRKRANAVIAKLREKNESHLAVAERLFTGLVDIAENAMLDTRLSVSLADLYRNFPGAERAGLECVLNAMVGARLLVLDATRDSARVEVAHESLIRNWDLLRTWLDEARAGLSLQRRVEQDALEWQRETYDPNRLYRGAKLVQISGKSWRSPFSGLAQQFLTASEDLRMQQELEAAARKLWNRLAIVGLFIAFLVAVAFGSKALQMYRIAAATARVEQASRAVLMAQATEASLDVLVLALGSLPPGSDLLQAGDSLHPRVVEAVTAAASRGGYPVFPSWPMGEHQPDPDEVRSESRCQGDRVSFSPDGKLAVTTSYDHTARLRDVQTGAVVQTIRGHTGWVTGASISPDGSRLVTDGADGTERLWNAKTAAMLEVSRSHGWCATPSFSPDGRHLLTVSFFYIERLYKPTPGSVVLYDTQAGAVLKRYQGVAASFVPEGARVLTDLQNPAKVLDAATGATMQTLRGDTPPIVGASFSSDGAYVVTASDDGTARLWSLQTGLLLWTLSGHSGRVQTATFSPSNQLLATAGADQTVKIWNVKTGALITSFSSHEGELRAASFSPDSGRVVTVSATGSARIWNAHTGAPVFTLQGHLKSTVAARFSGDGTHLLTAGEDDTARLWDISVGAALVTLRGHNDAVLTARFSPDGARVLTASVDGTARLWDGESGANLLVLKGHTGPVQVARFSPDGGRLVTASLDSTARLWDSLNGNEIHALKHNGAVHTAEFSPDGKLLSTAADEAGPRIWDVNSGRVWLTLVGHPGAPTSTSFSPDGTQVVSTGGMGTVRVWNVRTGNEDPRWREMRAGTWATAAGFSPNGTRLVTASNSGDVRVRDLSPGAPPILLRGHTGEVRITRFSPDGSKLLTAGRDESARIWNAKVTTPLVLRGHKQELTAACFSPDGRRILTASIDGTAKLWDVTSGELLMTFVGHVSAIRDAAFSPDGRRVVTASDDGTAHVYSTEVAYYARRACRLLRNYPTEFQQVSEVCHAYH